jgi:DNA-binding beta-propeller fold protein YncE
LYVSDIGNYRILTFPLDTNDESPMGTTIVGQAGMGSMINQIKLVYDMTIDYQRQYLYISDFGNHRILKLNLTNHVMSLAIGTGSAGSTNTHVNMPLGMTLDELTGSLYVADSRNHRIQKFDLNVGQGRTVAGNMHSGVNLQQLNLPSGVVLDSTGHIYVADSGNHRIVQWLADAQQGRIIAGTFDRNICFVA